MNGKNRGHALGSASQSTGAPFSKPDRSAAKGL